MLENMLELEELPTQSQLTLFKVLNGRKDYPSLARLCALKNLLPEIDAKLAEIPAAPVRAAWIQREGRTLDEVAESVRRERRVGVLKALAEMELADPSLYEVIAKANPSPTVATAVLTSEYSPVAAKEAAAAALAAAIDADKKVKLSECQTALLACPEAMEAFCLATQGYESLQVASLAEDISEDAASHVVGRLTAVMTKLAHGITNGETADSWGQYYRFEHAAQRVTQLGNTVLATTWATEEHRAELAAAFAEASAAAATASSAPMLQQWVARSWANIAQSWKSVSDAAITGGGSEDAGHCAELVERAGRVTTAAEVEEVIAKMAELKDSRRRSLVVNALLYNPHLGVADRMAAARQYDGIWRFFRRKDLTQFPIETWAAIALARPWVVDLPQVDGTGRLEEFTQLVVRNLRHCDNLNYMRELLVTSRALTAELLAEMPVEESVVLLGKDTLPLETRLAFATLLEEQLRGENESVWEMFSKMAPGFSGDLHELVAVCQASTGS